MRKVSKQRKSKVKQWFHERDVYTQNFPRRRNFNRRPTYANDIDHIWQADLADMRKVKTTNGGFTFILTCIDIFSKYAWAIPVKNKTGKNIIEAFKEIFKDNRYPKKLQTDKGTEFLNRPFQNFLKTNNIHFYTSHDDVTKAAVVERFNRTIKNRIFRYFTHKNTKKYIVVLSKIVEKS